MGFFSNATFNDGSSQFESAPAGVYVCRLANLDSVDRPSYDDPNVMVPNFKFTFETTEYGDSAGNAYWNCNLTTYSTSGPLVPLHHLC